MKLKIWLGFGDSMLFGRKDIPILMVVPRDGNVEQHLEHSSFLEADDIHDARAKMIKVIDEWYDHELHMVKLEKACSDKAAGIMPSVAPKTKPVYLNETSLSLGGDTESTPAPKGSDGLLDLGDLLK